MTKCKKILTWSSAATFMISSLSKAVNMHSFISETRLYTEAYMPVTFSPFYKEAAIVVCSCELLIALLLLHSRYAVAAAWMAFGTLTFFVYLTGVNLFMPTMFGSIESCGCFGELIHFSPLASFIKSLTLWGMCGWLLVLHTRQGETACREKKTGSNYLFISLAISLLPPAYSLVLLKKTDEGLYIWGYMILCMAIATYALSCVRDFNKFKIFNLIRKEVRAFFQSIQRHR